MDYDYKINKEPRKEVHNEVMLFLGDELERIHQETSSQSYDLEVEYEKTKHNKSFFTLIVLACTVIAVLGLGWGLSSIISKHDEEVTVSLSEFEDLNLKGLLDSVSKVQNQYDNALKNKMALENDMETALRTAESKLENDIFLLDSLSRRKKSEYNKKVAAVKEEYRRSVNAIHEEYDSQISLAEKQVAEYKAQLEEYNTTKIESARERERLLDSERQLRELQEKELTEKYEKRILTLETSIQELRNKSSENMKKSVSAVADQYMEEISQLDPIINNEENQLLIEELSQKQTPDYDAKTSLTEKEIKNERITRFYNEYQKLYDDYLVMYNTVKAIPQKNSIPAYVSSSHELVNEMSEAYVNTTSLLHDENVDLRRKVDKLNKDLEAEKKANSADAKLQEEGYDKAFSYLLNVAKANAVILSAEASDKVYVFVSQKIRELIPEDGADAELKAGKTVKGKVFLENGKYIFKPLPDKNGNEVIIDISKLEPGIPIKILGK